KRAGSSGCVSDEWLRRVDILPDLFYMLASNFLYLGRFWDKPHKHELNLTKCSKYVNAQMNNLGTVVLQQIR
ncbi:MAG: hypothetical protein AAB563_03090, partial [Patescibacteria group bacterium]